MFLGGWLLSTVEGAISLKPGLTTFTRPTMMAEEVRGEGFGLCIGEEVQLVSRWKIIKMGLKVRARKPGKLAGVEHGRRQRNIYQL